MEYPWIRNYDEGVPTHIEYPEKPLFHFLEEAAEKYPEKAKEMLAELERIRNAQSTR